MTIDWRNPTTIKGLIRAVIGLLFVVGVAVPDGAEEQILGAILLIDSLFTFRTGKKQTVLERKVDGRI